ncbi:hypothetical protein F164LOC_21560, partial [Pectobacterium carotovorum]
MLYKVGKNIKIEPIAKISVKIILGQKLTCKKYAYFIKDKILIDFSVSHLAFVSSTEIKLNFSREMLSWQVGSLFLTSSNTENSMLNVTFLSISIRYSLYACESVNFFIIAGVSIWQVTYPKRMIIAPIRLIINDVGYIPVFLTKIEIQGVRMSDQHLTIDVNPAIRTCSKNTGFIMQRFCFIGTLIFVG